MHRGSYYDSVFAIEMKNFFNYDANLTSVITTLETSVKLP